MQLEKHWYSCKEVHAVNWPSVVQLIVVQRMFI